MKKIILIYLFSLGFLFLSFLPQLYELSLAYRLPADRTLVAGEHIFTYDYNVYLAKIRQGQEGRWSVVDKYDNHPQQPGVLLQMFYLLSGKIGGLFRLSPPLIYHLLRLIVGFFWVVTIIYLNFHYLKQPVWAGLGVVFCLLSTSFPRFYRLENQWWVGQYMDWWQELDLIKRVSFIPHDVLNYINTGLFIAVIPRLDTFDNKQTFIFLLLIFLSLFIHPTAAIIFCLAWFFYLLISSGGRKPSLPRLKIALTAVRFLTVITVILIPLLYIRAVTSVYPWKTLLDFEQHYRLTVSLPEYFEALGPAFFLGMIGLALVVWKKDLRFLPLVAWVIAALAGIITFTYLPIQSPLRFVQTANHIPLAILSVYLLNRLWRRRSWPTLTKTIVVLITVGYIGLGLIQAYFSLKGQLVFIRQKIAATVPLVPAPPQVIYPLTDFYNGLQWLKANTRPDQVVLSKYTAGNYIPAYSGNFVYFGHAETPHYLEREPLVNQFFSGSLNPEAAYAFLNQENISYVFYGPQEKETVSDPQLTIDRYQFLKPVYQSPMVTIFKINK